jgi:metallo-beta-lactamase class B
MKNRLLYILSSTVLLAGLIPVAANAQAARAEQHMAAAKALASQPGKYDLMPTYTLLCTPRERGRGAAPAAPAAQAPPRAPQVPPRSEWYVEPAKVFDNLYNVGTEWYAWAVKTSDGVVLLNAGRDYAAEAIPEGLQKVGIDPASVKYVILHNADLANYGGAKLMQDRYHSRIMASEAGWNLIAKDTDVPAAKKPRKDMVVTDGQKLTLGDTTLTIYITPGNDPGTLTTVVPLKEGNQRHVGLMVGGRNLNIESFPSEEAGLKAWISTAARLRDIAAKANGDVFLSVRGLYDQEKQKAEALKTRKPGAPNPYVNKEAMDRYFQLIGECFSAQLARKAP